MNLIGAGIGMGLGGVGGGIGKGVMVCKRVEGMGGEREGGREVRRVMLMGVGLVEGVGIMGVVMGLLGLFG
ncbi:F0F1 ATP synthase subunit C [Bacillus sp. WP8]|uniref:F0F1 ATP synthase subunit C n=1 Tax=Bacillus sp. WP8 TaxID=756828 RepID=UPI0011A5BF4D|nr:F0F1 ATP synthase subunit C [Bacillus sp. WP8]